MRNLTAHGKGADARGAFTIVGHNADVALATLDEFVLLLWRRRIVPAGVSWTRQGFAKIIAERKDERKLIFLTALMPGCDVSTPSDVRKDIADLLKSHESQLACAAIVFEGNGFGMTIVRSVITAIYLTSRSRFPNGVFSTLDSALTWIAPHATAHGIQFESPRILSCIDKLRAL